MCSVSDECTDALGMNSGAIPDDWIEASSSYDEASVGPGCGRYVYLLYLSPVIHVCCVHVMYLSNRRFYGICYLFVV